MSILINGNENGALSVSDFFASDTGQPITLCMFVNTGARQDSGFYVRDVIELSNVAGDASLSSGFYQADTPQAGGQSSIENAVNGSNFKTIDIYPDLADAWRPVVISTNSTSAVLYIKNAAGSVQTNPFTHGRGATDYRNLTLFSGSVPFSTKAAFLAVYKAELSQAQVEEYMNTGAVDGLTPYSMWEATTDWGAGTITDSGSSGTNLTPPAAWTFSADNPTVGSSSTPTITDIDTDNTVYPGQSFVITGTNFGATQGTGTVDIDGVAQTVTAWSDTIITCTAVRGGNEYGTGKTLTVTTDAGTTATLTVAQEAEPNTFAITAASPNTTDDASLWAGLVDTSTGDPVTVVDGDQAWVKSGPAGVAVEPSGRITANETGPLIVQFWKASEGVWGIDQTVSFTLPEEPNPPGIGRGLKKALKLTLRKSLRSKL